MEDYMDILRDWERRVAAPCIFDHLDELLPSFSFRMVSSGAKRHWASPLKIDKSLPKKKTLEKSVVYPDDMKIREQGEWDSPLGVMDAIKDEHGLDSVYAAYTYVDSRYFLGMPKKGGASATLTPTKARRRAEILSVMGNYFVWNLKNNRSAKAAAVRSYLKKTRGFSQEAIERIGFGFVPAWDSVIGHVVTRGGFSKEEFDEACRVCNAEGRTMVGKTHTLAIPYVCAGETKGFIFRRVDGNDDPKYIANTGLDRKSVFFNMPQKTSAIVVVEGEMDALSATAVGIPGVVAMGGSAIAGERRKQVMDAFRRGVDRIYLCPDLDLAEDGTPDTATRHERIMKSIHTIKDVDQTFENIFVVQFPAVSDPDEYLRANGRDAFLDLVRKAQPWWEYVNSYYSGLKARSGE